MQWLIIGQILLMLLPCAEKRVWAQFDESIPATLVTFSGYMVPEESHPGEELRGVIEVTVATGWHIYSLVPSEEELAPPPTKIEWKANSLITKGPVYETNPIVQEDPAIGLVLAFHEHKVRFYQNFQVPSSMSPENMILSATIFYQTCSDKICLPPKKETLEIPFKVSAGEIRSPYAFMDRTIDPLPTEGQWLPDAGSIEQATSQGIFRFIILAGVMGMLAWFTPCVFPMIPITMSFFSRQSQKSHRELLRLALTFGAGIMVTYTATGLILTSVLGAAGTLQIASNPWVNLAIALLFIVFGLSFMGFFELQLPGAWLQSVDSLSRHLKGWISVLLMGVAFTMTAFTCTVQFVGTLLIAAAQGQWFWPVLGMLVFSRCLMRLSIWSRFNKPSIPLSLK
ncbi:MAG: hypothetical protein HQM12_20260 [SAR324 cluster bacterium]|nr:hypothetical protein [SAR324 cluster bacterium]